MMTIITGMHRSGTSMVTRMLNICGLDLGPEERLMPPSADNQAGYWEDSAMVLVNDAVLSIVGAGWDYIPPDLEPGWENNPRLDPLREAARKLIDSFGGDASWGWKDPRFCLTLPFWKSLLPDYKVVICLRHPVAVADSLLRRSGHSAAASLNLWFEYNRHLLQNTVPVQRVVTCYDTYFSTPQEELYRLLAGLGWSVPAEQVVQACETVSADLRHSHVIEDSSATQKLPLPVAALYEKLLAERDGGEPAGGQVRAQNPVTGPLNKQQLLKKSLVLLKQASDTGSVASGSALAEKVFSQFSEQAQLLYYYSLILAQRGDLEGSATYLTVALKYDENLAAAHNDLAIIRLELGQADQALQHLGEAARIEPDNLIYLENLGDAKLNTGNIAGALKAYQDILEIDGGNLDVRLKMAQAHVRLGENSLAVKICNELIASAPEHSGARQLLGRIT